MEWPLGYLVADHVWTSLERGYIAQDVEPVGTHG